MKIRYIAAVILMIIAVAAIGQQVQDGGVINTFGPSTLTSTYVATTNIDLKSYDSCTIIITVPTTQASAVGKVKPQWSSDGTNYYDEVNLTVGTTAAGETPFTSSSRVYVIDMSSTNAFVDRTRRLARYFKCAVASTNATTTATIQIVVKPENNNN